LVWTADAILFLDGRVTFHHVDGQRAKKNSGAPSVLVAYKQRAVIALRESGLAGCYIDLGANRVRTGGQRYGLFEDAA
jgi:hypothetical protein